MGIEKERELIRRPERLPTIEEILRPQEMVTISGEITSEEALKISQILLSWSSLQPSDKEITLFLNSQGGSSFGAHLIIDTIHLIENPVATMTMELAASGACLIAAAGTKGRRFATPDALFGLHLPFTGDEGLTGTVAAIKEEVKVAEFLQDKMLTDLSLFTGQPKEKILHDITFEKVFTAQEAKEYGLIDHIIPWRKDKKTGKVLIPSLPEKLLEKTIPEKVLEKIDPELFAGGKFNEEVVEKRMAKLRELRDSPDTPEETRKMLAEEIETLEKFHQNRKEQDENNK